MNSTPEDPAAEEPGPADASPRKVGPEDEKREDLRGEPSAAQAVKDEACRELQAETEPDEAEGRLMGLDAPGFGERTAADMEAAARRGGSEAAAREEATVAEEFGGMDNDLIDMSDFGEGGTGSGTQAGGAGERLRPNPSTRTKD